MSNPNRRHITVILDRSGSMHRVKDDTEHGLAAFLAEQQAVPGETFVSLYQFDSTWEPVYEFAALPDVPNYTLKPRGTTALLDAIGHTLTRMSGHFAAMPENDHPGAIQVVILTDGKENSSTHYHRVADINDMITTRQRAGWEFVFLGATLDAIDVAAEMGISADTSLSYSTDHTRETLTRAGQMLSRGSRRFTDDDRNATRY